MKRVLITLAIALLLACAVGYGVPALMQISQEADAARDLARTADISRRIAEHRDELFDYQCPYCKAISGALDQTLAENKDVRLVLKELPILGDDSLLASRAALAVPKEKYWAFHQALLQHRGDFDMTTLKAIAKSLGIDADQMEAGMAVAATEPAIRNNRTLATTIGVEATPTFIIGDQLFEGAPEPGALRELIARARKG